jgi:D-alanyl-lipoteichoic acid acyltransferase DltB (MBOAT superfamily)
MIFNSFVFLIFLVIFLLGYWSFDRKNRLILIFIASLLFYGFWRVEFLFLLLFTIFVNYLSSIFITIQKSQKKKKIILIICLFFNFSLLVFFKYYYFITDNFNYLFKFFRFEINLPILNIILPIGISFYTFQSVSYIIDVFSKKIKHEKNFILFCNYIIFFPQLVAGPILRAKEVIFQLSQKPVFISENIYLGIKRILFGFFLKVVIADNLSPIVEKSFLVEAKYLSAIDVFTMSYLFGFQIYFDFSAYSHIALGLALLMNVRFPENFNYPYHSITPKEFWTRWHITLSSWTRDYIYLPLLGVKNLELSSGGFKKFIYRKNISFKYIYALVITWLLMGLWHGANWKFLLWGLIHSLIIIFFRFFDKFLKIHDNKILNFISWIFTLQFIMLSWVPFRANNFLESIDIWSRLFDFHNWFNMSFTINTYLVAFIITIIYLILPYSCNFFKKFFLTQIYIKKCVEIFSLFIIISLILIYFTNINQFIYFQF